MTKTKTTTNDLHWRLFDLPTPTHVVELVKTNIITEDEARSILFRTDDEKRKDDEIDALKKQIGFLKSILDNLSNKQVTTLIYAPSTPKYTYWPHHADPVWLSTTGVGGVTQTYSINTAKLLN